VCERAAALGDRLRERIATREDPARAVLELPNGPTIRSERTR